MRKKKDHNENVIKQCLLVVGSDAELKDIGKTSSQRLLLGRNCGNHYAIITAEGANKHETELGCHICNPGKGRCPQQFASIHITAANNVINKAFTDAIVVTEARVLQHFNGGMDFTIYWLNHKRHTCCLDIEVDGEQHSRNNHHGTSKVKQKELDRRKNDLVWKQGRRLLRLHYQDKDEWLRNLKEAKTRVERSPRKSFVMRSSWYTIVKGFRLP